MEIEVITSVIMMATRQPCLRRSDHRRTPEALAGHATPGGSTADHPDGYRVEMLPSRARWR